MAPISVEKLTPHVGAVISGVDLSKPLDEGTFKHIHDCLIDNGVIFFRDQHLTPVRNARIRVGVEYVHRIVLRRRHDYVVNASTDVHIRHPQRLRVDRSVRGTRKQLAERRAIHQRCRQRVFLRIHAVAR